MIYSEIAAAKHRLKRCYEAFSDAELLLQSGTVDGALVMCLRAAKEATEAALTAAGDKAPRSESLLFLASQLVGDGRLSASSFNAFRTMMDLCQFACERDFSVVRRDEAAAAIENVKHFIREMGDMVKR
jgi:HEPN domain-containing protein